MGIHEATMTATVEHHQKLANLLIAGIQNRAIPPGSAMDIIRLGMETVETFKGLDGPAKAQLLIDVLLEMAKGADGREGTRDDVIPLHVRQVLRALNDTGVLPGLIDMTVKASKGLLQLNKKNGIFGCCK